MQKLSGKLKNTPRNVQSLQVPCSVNPSLNKEETLSVLGIVRTDNNPKGVQRSTNNQGLQPKVFVLSLKGEPLMPTKASRARTMLKAKKAKVIKRTPFTIQLTFECENKTQEIVLGVDSGYSNIGFSAVTKKEEIISGTLKLDNQTSNRLKEKAMYRRNRRNMLWYRKPRFMNRVASKKKGWLPPSTERRLKTHINIIEKIKKILPVSKVIIEVGNFDIQKIENPNIKGKEYQQGNMFEYQNMRSYLMAREKGLCQLCQKEFSKTNPSHIHHIIPQSKGGTDKSNNLALLHRSCHEKLHKKNLYSLLKKNKQFKDATFMSIVRWKFQELLSCEITFGNITFVNRNELGLEKNHVNDAFVIAKGNFQNRIKENIIEQKRRHNRAIQLNRKGFKPSIRTSIYKIQPKDLVWYNKKKFEVIGIQNRGAYVKVKDYQKVIPIKKIEKFYHFGSLAWIM